MKVIFLGTGTSQGVPVIACQCKVCTSLDPKDKRLRASVLIEKDGVHFVVDTGPDFRQQMLRHEVRKLDAVLFTHGHKDHTAGFDDIRGFNFIQGKAMDVFVDDRVEEVLRRDFYYCFTEFKYPGIPELKLHRIENKGFSFMDVDITPIATLHYKLPVFGFRIGDFSYITDANYISPEELEKLKGSKYLVLNALKKTTHISHFTLDEAIEVAKEVGAEHTFFTHMSHQMGQHATIQAELPDDMSLAYDGLELQW